jgi:hypothetical protein
LKQIKNAIV